MSAEALDQESQVTFGETLRTQLDGMLDVARPRDEELVKRHNKTITKHLARIALRRPSKEKTQLHQRESMRATNAVQVLEGLRDLSWASPDDAENGFQVRYVQRENPNPHDSALKNSTEHTLDVRPSEEGISLVVTNESEHKAHDPISYNYFVSNSGEVFQEIPGKGEDAEPIRVPIDGTWHERIENGRYHDSLIESGLAEAGSEPEWDYLPSQALEDAMTMAAVAFPSPSQPSSPLYAPHTVIEKSVAALPPLPEDAYDRFRY